MLHILHSTMIGCQNSYVRCVCVHVCAIRKVYSHTAIMENIDIINALCKRSHTQNMQEPPLTVYISRWDKFLSRTPRGHRCRLHPQMVPQDTCHRTGRCFLLHPPALKPPPQSPKGAQLLVWMTTGQLHSLTIIMKCFDRVILAHIQS